MPHVSLLRRVRRITSALTLAACLLIPAGQVAWSSGIHLAIHDTIAYPGQEIQFPVWMTNNTDAVAGIQFDMIFDRPGILGFDTLTVSDTLIICSDPPGCTVYDTTINIFVSVPLGTGGTSVEGWDIIVNLPRFPRPVMGNQHQQSDTVNRREPAGSLPSAPVGRTVPFGMGTRDGDEAATQQRLT